MTKEKPGATAGLQGRGIERELSRLCNGYAPTSVAIRIPDRIMRPEQVPIFPIVSQLPQNARHLSKWLLFKSCTVRIEHDSETFGHSLFLPIAPHQGAKAAPCGN
ncbi:MAG: hypothetical protein E6Q76_15720 [Rhizobium sp.]|nr:MAG: hypothetical protein E6Q76_15720 [Rhizobium sp.]